MARVAVLCSPALHSSSAAANTRQRRRTVSEGLSRLGNTHNTTLTVTHNRSFPLAQRCERINADNFEYSFSYT